MDTKNKDILHREYASERTKNIIDISDPSNSNTFNSIRGRKKPLKKIDILILNEIRLTQRRRL